MCTETTTPSENTVTEITRYFSQPQRGLCTGIPQKVLHSNPTLLKGQRSEELKRYSLIFATYENILFLVFWIISLEYFSGNRVPVPKIWTFLWLLLFSTCTAFQKDWTSLHSYHISYMYHVCMHVYTHTHFSTQQTYEEHATVNLIFIDEDTKGHRG